MRDHTRVCRLALCLGPCGTGTSLKETDPSLETLRTLWPHRLAHAFWQRARDPEDLFGMAQRLLARLHHQGMRAVLATDEEYPHRLWRLPDAPSVLYVQGSVPQRRAVALVGSRAAYREGLASARGAAADLARRGVTVVSGGALGIDTAAHEGALEGGGRTVAILGSGLDRPYPERNLDLFRRVTARGAVVSTFAPGTPPLRGCFPRRNRLIAALADVVVVVEAGRRSGALQTARWAERLHIPVLAGDNSPGGKRLLRQGAGIFSSAGDVLCVLSGAAPVPPHAPELSNEDQRVALGGLQDGPRSVDELARQLRWSAARTALVLVGLQVAGLVRVEEGGRYSVEE